MAGNVQQQGEDPTVEIVNRIRVLESKYTQLGERVLVINQNLIKQYKKLAKDIRAGEENIKDVKNDLNNVKNILKHLTEEAADFAKKDSLKILEKYINLWNPLNFVTETDVKRMIEEVKHGGSTHRRSTADAKTRNDKRTDSLSPHTKRVHRPANKRRNKPSKHKAGSRSHARKKRR